jgi:hypothetical protein
MNRIIPSGRDVGRAISGVEISEVTYYWENGVEVSEASIIGQLTYLSVENRKPVDATTFFHLGHAQKAIA